MYASRDVIIDQARVVQQNGDEICLERSLTYAILDLFEESASMYVGSEKKKTLQGKFHRGKTKYVHRKDVVTISCCCLGNTTTLWLLDELNSLPEE